MEHGYALRAGPLPGKRTMDEFGNRCTSRPIHKHKYRPQSTEIKIRRKLKAREQPNREP